MKNSETISPGRIIKVAISLCVFAFSEVREIVQRWLKRTPAGRCVVLYYHSVPREQRASFAWQMEMLRRHAVPISLNRDVILGPGVRAAAVTIDDAFENLIENAIPALERRNIPATIFAISGAMGKDFGGDFEPSERVMSLEQLRSLPQPLITVGSHTVSHPFLPAVSREEARWELQQSRAQLSELLHRDIRLFSFPFGGCTKDLVQICRQAGYHRVFTTLPSFAFTNDPAEFVVGRVRVDPTDWHLEFRLKLAGAYRWLPWAFRTKRRFLKFFRTLMPGRSRAPHMTVPRAVIQ